MLTATGFLVAGVVGAGLWWVYGRVLLLGQMRGRGGMGMGMGVWRRGSCQQKKDYELVERHEV